MPGWSVVYRDTQRREQRSRMVESRELAFFEAASLQRQKCAILRVEGSILFYEGPTLAVQVRKYREQLRGEAS